VAVDYDVLKRHHTTNGRRRPPSPTMLDSVRSNGMGMHKKAKLSLFEERSKSPEDSHPSGEEADDVTRTQDQIKPAKGGRWSVNPKGTLPVNPTTLRAFPALWVKCLDNAKARMRRHVAVFDAFPSIVTALDGPCNESLLETLAWYQDEGRQLEKGKYRVLVSDCFPYLH
jgi:hypothetical protein